MPNCSGSPMWYRLLTFLIVMGCVKVGTQLRHVGKVAFGSPEVESTNQENQDGDTHRNPKHVPWQSLRGLQHCAKRIDEARHWIQRKQRPVWLRDHFGRVHNGCG